MVAALLAIGMTVGVQRFFFADFRALHEHGVVTQATVRDRGHWVENTRRRANHYEWTLRYATPAGWTSVTLETNCRAFDAYPVGSKVPVTYLPEAPKVMQLGDEVGIPQLDLLLFVFLCVVMVPAIFGGYFEQTPARVFWTQDTKCRPV